MGTKQEVLDKLRSAFNTFESISDICDDAEATVDDIIDDIRMLANGELAGLEQTIMELEDGYGDI